MKVSNTDSACKARIDLEYNKGNIFHPGCNGIFEFRISMNTQTLQTLKLCLESMHFAKKADLRFERDPNSKSTQVGT